MGARIDEWSAVYGSAATKRKVYVGKVTNYFKRIGVAEIQVEAAPLRVGDETFLVGETTGVLEFPTGEIRVDEQNVQQAPQGVFVRLKYLRRSTGAINCISSWMRKGTDKRDKTTGKSNEYRKLIA